ncbi:MAG: methyl-accepting chemotaxis sensory transducer, partial [Rhodocyclaceae bacterium]
MSIGKKIIGGYLVVLALLALVVLVAFYSLARIQTTYNGFIDVDEQLVEGADQLRFELRSQIARYRAILLYPDLQEKYQEELRTDHRQFKEVVEKMRRAVLTGEGRTMLDEIAAQQAKSEQAQTRVIDLARQGKRAEALALGIKEVRPLSASLIEKVRSFRDRQVRLVEDERAKLTATVNLLTLVMVGAALLALVAGLTIGIYLSRSITRQLRESIAQIASSSGEILATTTQVASGAAETAAAVSETTATVEE